MVFFSFLKILLYNEIITDFIADFILIKKFLVIIYLFTLYFTKDTISDVIEIIKDNHPSGFCIQCSPCINKNF